MKTKYVVAALAVLAVVVIVAAGAQTGTLGAVPPKTRTPVNTITPVSTKTVVAPAATNTPARTGELTYGRVNVDSYNANPALEVNQRHTGNIAVFEDAGTAVLTLADGGNLTWAADTGTDLLNLTTGNLKVGNGTPGVTLGGEDAYVEGTFEVDGAADLASTLTLGAATLITATNGAAFAPLAVFQPLTAAGTVTPTITIPAAGRVVCLYNTSAQTINIADTGNQVLAGAWAAGQYDTLCVYSDGTRAIEIFRSNN